MATKRAATLGELRTSGYEILPIREEMRKNLIEHLGAGDDIFPGILGFDETVIPQLQNAILAGQDVIMLGERGQAKSRIIRSLTSLLDEWTPVLDEAEIPENPFNPITADGRAVIADQGDSAPIRWMHRDERYGEKLATPDITIADLIGEIDPIKVAEGRYLSDELTIHYGLIPRTNRGIFAINELPDLAERIQVGLLNVMEERDIQIRGHKVRLALDVFIVATANPEDYTNRGRIITPLKDRYGSQIRTHYPASIEHEIGIIEQEYSQLDTGDYTVEVPEYMMEIVAEITRLARRSPDVNQRSGVSVRASVADYEALRANALRRSIRLGETDAVPRISDLPFVLPAFAGKVEFETVEEGRDDQVIERLVQGAVVAVFNRRCNLSELEPIVEAFKAGLSIDTGESLPVKNYSKMLKDVEGLAEAVAEIEPDASEAAKAAAIEFLLEGLHLNKRLNKDQVSGQALARYRG
ncbi:MAG: sigma 54-interacting transcriptional regulator [Dehalococcoidia bacterium]